jgi:hypothetical protein
LEHLRITFELPGEELIARVLAEIAGLRSQIVRDCL